MARSRQAVAAALVALTAAVTATAMAQERPSPAGSLTGEGRKLQPAGRMTPLGAFPTGGALAPDGRFYWAVDAGRGANFVRIIDVSSGAVRQTLPLPGGYVGITFSPDGRRAYVSGAPSDGAPPSGSKGPGGDVIHVYSVNPRNGRASELDPLALPNARDGAAAGDELPPASNVLAWPEGIDVTTGGRYLVVALGQADQLAIVDLKTRAGTLANVGRYPYGVVVDPRRARAYVTNERDGTVSAVDVPSGKVVATIDVGAGRADYAHPQGLAADPVRNRLYVAVTDRDRVAVIDTNTLRVTRYLDVSRRNAAIGTAPVATAVAPDGDTLYVANAGEDAVAAFTLTRRPPASAARRRRVVRVKSTRSIGRYRTRKARARRRLRRVLRRTALPVRRRVLVRRYRRALRRLDRRYLRGRVVRSCRGPSRRGERRWVRSVLKALDRLARDRRRARRRRGARARKRARARAGRRYRRTIARARRRVKLGCPRRGFLPNAPAFHLLGRLPTAAYTTDVEITPKGGSLVWLAAKGLGTGSNSAGPSPARLLFGRAGVLGRPTDKGMVAFTPRADRQLVPSNFTGPPPNTPLLGPGGGPSDKIKHVFYVVKENRTYDQIFGSEPRGRGDPRFQVFDDNGVPGPTGGVTPNAHALARTFPLLDSVYANSEESTLGHKITAGGYANDYTQRYVNTSRGRKGNPDIFPIGIPPNAFIFDQAVRQGVPFRVYGELGAGNQPFSDDGRSTYNGVLTNTDPAYPSQVQGTCRPAVPTPPGTPNSVRCTADAGEVSTGPHTTTGPPATQSRIRTFAGEFQSQVASGAVPAFNYLILFNNHTDGTTPGTYTPKANVADNDLALGQLVELVSNSPIWDKSAIFVIEDDSQDGIDSVDAHRIPAHVISPWARRGAVVSTRYDQYSFLRTAEMIVGLRPLSINDALATPLYDAFISGNEQPDVNGTRYLAVQPNQSLTQVNPTSAADARLSAALPWDKTDYVPQRLADQILWHSVFGAGSRPPAAGPGASPVERARATGALRRYRSGKSARRWLLRHHEEEDETRAGSVVELLSAGGGLSRAQARKRVGD